GLQQIADILVSNNLTDLSSISIVGHGSADGISLGSTVLGDNDLASHTDALSAIGSSLTSNGDLLLYSCGAAAGDTGRQFIAGLSAYTGADVAGSTGLVGSTALGGSWTLDVSTGPIEAGAPFDAATLTDFVAVLADPTLTATQSKTLTGDTDGDGVADPGETVTTSVTITNTSATDALNVSFSEPLNGMTLVPGSIKIT